MTRTLHPLKLTKSPLVLVLCQVRFSQVLAMPDYYPKIQDRLRRKGYPISKNAVVQEGLLLPGGISSVQSHRWQALNREQTRSIVVTNDFLVFQTSVYDVFETFTAELRLAVETVASTVDDLIVERVGLRYVDLVRPQEGENWTAYVRPELRGLQSSSFTQGTQLQLHQSVAKTTNGTMIVRLFQNRDGKFLPPDMADSDLKRTLEPQVRPGELLTVLDLDHFSVRQLEFSADAIDHEAWLLHDALDHVFRESVVTQEALDKWK